MNASLWCVLLYLLSDQDCWTLQGDAHHLMWIPCDGVCSRKLNIFVCFLKFFCKNLNNNPNPLKNKNKKYLSTPLSLWRCFLDISSPPPHAPWTEEEVVLQSRSFVNLHSSSVSYSHQHEATSYTSHKCQRSHWWDQTRRTPWIRRWRSQRVAHNPAESQRGLLGRKP